MTREIRSDQSSGNTARKAFRLGDGINAGRGLIHFDLSAYADDLLAGTIDSLEFKLPQFAPDGGDSSAAGTDVTIDLHLCTTPFNTQASWTSAGPANWTTPGGDITTLLSSSSGNPEAVGTVAPFRSTPGFISAIQGTIAGDG